jgi:hypothetical protein
MIGSGMPMSQSNAPFPNDIFSLHLMFQRRLQFARVPLVPCSTPFDLADAFVIAIAGSEIVGVKASPVRRCTSDHAETDSGAALMTKSAATGGARRRRGDYVRWSSSLPAALSCRLPTPASVFSNARDGTSRG